MSDATEAYNDGLEQGLEQGREEATASAAIVARMRKALETWEAQAEGMRKAAAQDLVAMNIEGAMRIGKEAVVLEAMARFLRMCLDAD